MRAARRPRWCWYGVGHGVGDGVDDGVGLGVGHGVGEGNGDVALVMVEIAGGMATEMVLVWGR